MPSSKHALKRKRPLETDDDDADSYSEVAASSSDEDVDISSALTGKKSRREVSQASELDTDGAVEDLHDVIQESISKRNMRGGTELLKKTKGKKITKGEVGGGSFQSMGALTGHLIGFVVRKANVFYCRSPSLAVTVSYSAGLPYTHAHTEALHTRTSCYSTA